MSKTQNNTECAFRTRIGGQALIEGILMRGMDRQCIVVRKPDGEFAIKEEKLQLVKDRYPILGWPLIRGVVTFLSSMVNGVKALMWSAEFYPEDEEETKEPGKVEKWLNDHLSDEKMTSLIVTASVVMGIALSIGLFLVLPVLIGTVVTLFSSSQLLRNIVEAVLKCIIFMGYLILCSKTKDMKRVFAYHGAEHKSIFCYEKGLELTVENVRPQKRHHPRCGTSFLVVVIIVSILVSTIVFTLVEIDNVFLRILCKLLLLPIVVGVTYEINSWCGRVDNVLTRIIAAPGLWVQNFTTNEPDDSMIEVALEALKRVLPEEKGADIW